MPVVKPGRIVIRDFLIPGHHDTLLEMLALHNRKAGNQMVLSISEACLAKWPLGLSDYEPAPEALLEKTRIKITIREDRHPSLFQLYRSIGLGSKGQIFLNMFNRHQLMRQEDPVGVNQAVTKMHEMLIAKMEANGQSDETRATLINAREMGIPEQPTGTKNDGEQRIASVGPSNEAVARSAAVPDVQFVVDPLTSVGPMSF
jgi:hypothetical protein